MDLKKIYTQFKFIWNFDKYYQYQKDVADKYLWINYLKSKVGMNVLEVTTVIKIY